MNEVRNLLYKDTFLGPFRKLYIHKIYLKYYEETDLDRDFCIDLSNCF